MRMKISKLFAVLLLLAASFLNMESIESRGGENPYSGMTVLDLSRGSIIIGTDSITGYDKNGVPVKKVNGQGYHIICSNDYGTSNKITVDPGVDTKIVADNLNIFIYSTDEKYPSPLFIRPGASVTLILEGENKFSGAPYNAAVGVPQASDGTMAELTIEGNGSLYCSTGKRGAGIGGGQKCGYTEGAGIITINSGTIDAKGGDYGGGIGNSERTGSKNCRITINGGTIDAQSDSQSSGIGGGRSREPKKADIIINGGVIYSAGPGSAIRGSSLEVNGGNVIACQNNDSVNWQSFDPSPAVDQDGNNVRFASVQLDSIDADRKLSVTCGSRTYSVFSDNMARVNVILFQKDGSDITIKSESGNEYVMDYGTLADPAEITDRPYRYPLLTITPESGQTSQYGDSFRPAYQVYDDKGRLMQDTESIITGNPAYEKIPSGSTLPYNAKVTHGDLKVIDSAHCITFTRDKEIQILKRSIQVSAQDLEVYEGQYTKDNLPFVLRLEEGTLAPGDTIENAFTFSADSSGRLDYYPAGVYADMGFHFNSKCYDVSLKGKGPTLRVLENECLLKKGDYLTFGTDTEGRPVQWLVMNLTDSGAVLYSKNVYGNSTYDQAKDIRNNSISYILEKFPDLTKYHYITGADILDSQKADQVYLNGGMKNAGTKDVNGNPARYWMFEEETKPYYEKAVYMDENGRLKESSDDTMTAGVRFMMNISVRTHTVPVIALSDKITSSLQYGDIAAGTKVAEVNDTANITGHERISYRLLDKSTAADSFTLKDDGTIVADKMLKAGSYTLYIESEDSTGYNAEGSVTFTVRQRQIEIVPHSGIFMYVGESVPKLPYTYNSSQLLSGDTLRGSLSVNGDLTAAGQYPITLGTLSAGENYHLILAGGVNLTVLNVKDSEKPGGGEDGRGGTSGKRIVRRKSNGTAEDRVKAASTRDNQVFERLFMIMILSAAASVIVCRKWYKSRGK